MVGYLIVSALAVLLKIHFVKRLPLFYCASTVMARIAKPVSKRSSVEMLEQEYGVTADVNAVYRMMDLLDQTAIDKTKHLSYQYTKSLLDEKVNIIFYDCTTLYFESFI